MERGVATAWRHREADERWAHGPSGELRAIDQGVQTGEISPIHPGAAPVRTTAFDAATGGYTTLVSVVDPKINLLIDPATRSPRTDEYSIGIDCEFLSRLTMAVAYIRNGSQLIAWRTSPANISRRRVHFPTSGHCRCSC